MTMKSIIMAGGEGTRFQPLSTPQKPKQFLNLLDPKISLIQQTYDRLISFIDGQNIWVATNARYVDLIREQLPKIDAQNIILETEKKNTGPCLAWACHQIFKTDEKAVVVATPADHFITPTKKFREALTKALKLAQDKNAVVTLGIIPTTPSTQYGYIHRKEKKFIEKPDTVRAKEYLASGDYYWNSGIFIFPVKKMLEEIQKHLPEIFSLLKTSKNSQDFFEKAPSISIDYGVMEKLGEIFVLEADFIWSDVGTWENLAKLSKEQKIKLPEEVTRILKRM